MCVLHQQGRDPLRVEGDVHTEYDLYGTALLFNLFFFKKTCTRWICLAVALVFCSVLCMMQHYKIVMLKLGGVHKKHFSISVLCFSKYFSVKT